MTFRKYCRFNTVLRTSSAMTAISLLAIMPAYALPQGGQVVGGQANIATSGNQATVTQSTNRAIINWQSFDIGHGSHVAFHQPSSASVTLNRVTGSQHPSQIMGKLTANGTVMLVNPSGMVFGPGAQVNVGRLVATSNDIADERFMAGDYRFDRPGNPNAAIVNRGHITVAETGLAAFVAPHVVNDGVIEARLGQVQLASGDQFTLDLHGDGLIHLEASDAVRGQLVSHSGVIVAEGGKVLLTAAAAGEVVDSVINMDGVIRATSIGERNGEIVIFAEGSNAVSGNESAKKGHQQGSSTVLVSGVLDASGRGNGERGGSITVTGDNVALLAGTVIDASGHTGQAGTTEGKTVSAVREGAAGGDIRIGGDYLGQGSTPTASYLYVDPGVLLLNDATFTGDAGRTIFWSDGTTQFFGNVYARALGGKAVDPLTWNATAGGNPGDGGFVETSGYQHLEAGGYVDLTSSSGKRGTYFLDPEDIVIYGNFDPAFQSTDGTLDLATSLNLWLDASDASKITLTYSTDGLSGATASGTAGTNTITTSANVSANLAVGARIRLGAAGDVTTAEMMGDHTYTIASISGTTITTVEALTQDYSAQALRRGVVSQLADKSADGNHATQTTQARMPLWISNAQNGQSVLRFDGTNDWLQTSVNDPVNLVFSAFNQKGITPSVTQGIITARNSYSSMLPASVEDSGFAVTPSHRIRDVDNAPKDMSGAYINGVYTTASNSAPGAPYNNAEPAIVATLAPNSATGAKNYVIGGDVFDANRASVADIMELLVLATTDDVSRNLVEQYQSAKWDIALTPPGTGATEAAKAMAGDGYSAFTTRYLERLSQTADISLQATNSITLDLKGDTLALAADRNFSLTTTDGNITSVSAGNIETTRTTTGGNITLTAGGSGVIDIGNLTLTASNGGSITLESGGALSLGVMSAGSVLAHATGTGSNVTLNGDITASAISGSSVVLSAAGNFLNPDSHGIHTDGSARWLIYSTRPEQNMPGGLTGEFSQYAATYDSLPPALIGNAGQNGLLYSHADFVRFTANDLTRLYGDANPFLTYNFFCSTGCTQALAVTGAPTLSTAATTTTGVGDSSIVISMGTLALTGAYANYVIELVDGTLTVNLAPLTITANNQAKTYGNLLDFIGTEFTAAGLRNGEGIGSVSLSSDGAVAGAAVAGGPYAITASNADGGTFNSANYAITYHSGTLTVDHRLLSILNVAAEDKVYDGTTSASLDTDAATLDGVMIGDTVNLLTGSASGAFLDKDVGTGKTVTASGFAISGADSGNYLVNQPAGLTADITPKQVTAALTGSTNKIFDGTTLATLTQANYSLSGILGTDSVTLNFPMTGNYTDPGIGTGKLVSVDGLALLGNDTANYFLASTLISGAIGRIDPAPVPAGLPDLGDIPRILQGVPMRYYFSMNGAISSLSPAKSPFKSSTHHSLPHELAPAANEQTSAPRNVPHVFVDPRLRTLLNLPPWL